MAIDKFKSNKVAQYMRMLNNFAVREISNAHLAATMYHQLLELVDTKWAHLDTWADETPEWPNTGSDGTT